MQLERVSTLVLLTAMLLILMMVPTTSLSLSTSSIGGDIRINVTLVSALRFLGASHRTRDVATMGEVHAIASWFTQTTRVSPQAFGQSLFSGIRAVASSFPISIPAPQWSEQNSTTTRRRLVVNETALRMLLFLTDAASVPAARVLQNNICVVRSAKVGSFVSNRVCVNENEMTGLAAAADSSNGLIPNVKNTPAVNAQVCDAVAAILSKPCNVEPESVVYCSCPSTTSVNVSLLSTTSAPTAGSTPTILRSRTFTQPLEVTYSSDMLDWEFLISATLPPKFTTSTLSSTLSRSDIKTASVEESSSNTVSQTRSKSAAATVSVGATATVTSPKSVSVVASPTTSIVPPTSDANSAASSIMSGTGGSSTTSSSAATTSSSGAPSSSSGASVGGSGIADPVSGARSPFQPQADLSGYVQLQLELQLQHSDPTLWWQVQEVHDNGTISNYSLTSFGQSSYTTTTTSTSSSSSLEVDPDYIREVLVSTYKHIGIVMRHVIINTSFPFLYALRKDTLINADKLRVMTKNVTTNSTNQYVRDVKPYYCQQRAGGSTIVSSSGRYTPEPWEASLSSYYATNASSTSAGQPIASFLEGLQGRAANINRTWNSIVATTTTLYAYPSDSVLSYNVTDSGGDSTSTIYSPSSASVTLTNYGLQSFRWFRRYTTSQQLVDSKGGGDLMYRGNRSAADTDGWFYCANDVETIDIDIPTTTANTTTTPTTTNTTTTTTTITITPPTTTNTTTPPTTTNTTTTPTTTATTTSMSPTITASVSSTNNATNTVNATTTTTMTTTTTTTTTADPVLQDGASSSGGENGALSFHPLWFLLLLLIIPLVPICFFGVAGIRTCLMKAKWEQHKQQAFSLGEDGDGVDGKPVDQELVEGMGDGNWLSKYQPSGAITAANLGGGAAHSRLRAAGGDFGHSDEDDEEHQVFDPVRDHTLQQQALRDKMERRHQRRKEKLREQRAAAGEDGAQGNDDDEELYSATGSNDGNNHLDRDEEDDDGYGDDGGRNKNKTPVSKHGSEDDSSSEDGVAQSSSIRHVDPTSLGGYLFKEPDVNGVEDEDDDAPRTRNGGASLGRVLGNREW